MLDWPELTLFLFVTARVGGFVLFNPILGRTNIPAAFRTGMALVLSVFVTSVTEQRPAQPSGLAAFMVLMLLEIFAGGGHLTLLRMFITSEQIVPFGQVAVGLPAYQLLLELFVECTVLSVKLCMPVLAAELIAQVGMGVLMKVIPQINVFAINIELKVIVGLALVLVLTVPFSEFLLQAELAMLNALHDVLALTG